MRATSKTQIKIFSLATATLLLGLSGFHFASSSRANPVATDDLNTSNSFQIASSGNPHLLSSLANATGRINVRSGAGTNHSVRHYGFSGDPVFLLSDAEGSDGYIWNYVKFQQSGAEGWVRSDLLSFTLDDVRDAKYER